MEKTDLWENNQIFFLFPQIFVSHTSLYRLSAQVCLGPVLRPHT